MKNLKFSLKNRIYCNNKNLQTEEFKQLCAYLPPPVTKHTPYGEKAQVFYIYIYIYIYHLNLAKISKYFRVRPRYFRNCVKSLQDIAMFKVSKDSSHGRLTSFISFNRLVFYATK